MLPKVRKRNGSIEEYIPEKLIVSINKNGVPISAAREIERSIRGEVEGKDYVSTLELAYHALTRVRKYGEPYFQSWIYYDINHKRRRTDFEIEKLLDKKL
ncbi:MAG: hypothetical protein LRS47_00865 [Desulfurococcales archaeon]|nr:hypothetical protein [Desulfurococcales archaeon]